MALHLRQLRPALTAQKGDRDEGRPDNENGAPVAPRPKRSAVDRRIPARRRPGQGELRAESVYDAAADADSMYATTTYTRARAWWKAGYASTGIDIAVIDSGISPVQELSAPDKIVSAGAPTPPGAGANQ